MEKHGKWKNLELRLCAYTLHENDISIFVDLIYIVTFTI